MRPIIRGQKLMASELDSKPQTPEPAQDVLASPPEPKSCYTGNVFEYSLNKVKQTSQLTPFAATKNEANSIEASPFGKEEVELDPELEPFKDRMLANNGNELLCLQQIKQAQEHVREVARNEKTLLRQKAYLDGELAAFEEEDISFSAEDHDHLMSG